MNTTHNATHTPGPWGTGKRFGGNRRSQLKIYAGALLVAEVSTMPTVRENDGHSPEANARLIAAAPALFAALENLLVSMECKGVKIPEYVGAQARAALAAAQK